MAREVITERSQLLLKALVERYIREGQPVGSKALLECSGLPISPATVRNIMADLEELGLIRAPHTSAGRIPTSQGYRLFVDSLITVRPLEEAALASLRQELTADKSSKELIESASQLLSRITAQAGIVTLPRQQRVVLRQIEFLPLSDNRVLVILVINEREVQNRVIYTGRAHDKLELQRAANMLNQRFAGQDLSEVRAALFDAMQADKATIDRHMQTTLDLASKALEIPQNEAARDYVMTGETQLIGNAGPEEIDKLKGLFEAFQQKREILDLIDRCIRADGVQIFIGEEAGYDVFGDYSVITAPYQVGGQSLGVLGVIGPTRMAYESVIPIVDLTARMLSLALKSV
ncbi:MAG: heat-inducible transcription repressor HrcA [Verrucomicrobiaceae bacterium]|nr:heat-inducible transcription repressor HrcA [Verrucomicrobiaceae bacterium]